MADQETCEVTINRKSRICKVTFSFREARKHFGELKEGAIWLQGVLDQVEEHFQGVLACLLG